MQGTGDQWICVSDFDGTISSVDATDRLLEEYADPAWQDIEAEWKSGLIGSRECLARQIALIREPKAKIEALARSISIDPEFKSFAHYCERSGTKLVIVSDGLDCLINPILQREGLSHIPVFSNALVAAGHNAFQLASPYADAICCSGAGTCKCAVIDMLSDDANTSILYVGDGRSDFCAAARSADIIAAKSSLARHLEATGRSYRHFDTFEDVRLLLSGLLRSPVATVEKIREAQYELH